MSDYPLCEKRGWVRTYGGKTYVPAILVMQMLGDASYSEFAQYVNRIRGVGLDAADVELLLKFGLPVWLKMRIKQSA